MTSTEGSLLAVYGYSAISIFGYVSFFICFITSISYLIRRKKTYDLIAGAAAESGVILICLALFTGISLEYAVQNRWGAWDKHFTKTLILWILYIVYLILRSSSMAKKRRAAVSAGFAIIAFLYAPVVLISANIWRSEHSVMRAIKNVDKAMAASMQQTMLIGVLVLIFVWIFLFKWRFGLLRRREKFETRIIVQ